MGEVAIERLPSETFVPDTDLVYEDVFNLHPLFDKIAFQANLILVGPKGVAKTLSIAAWAGANKCPIVTFDCSEDIRRAHLLGMFILRGKESPFVLGPITTAIEVANEVGRCTLCLEEINCVHPTTRVMIPTGEYIPIERLRVGDSIVGFDAHGHQHVERVLETHLDHADWCRTIEADEIQITASRNHRFWTRRGWVFTSDLCIGDEVLHLPNVRMREDGPALSSRTRADGSRGQPHEEPRDRAESQLSGEVSEAVRARTKTPIQNERSREESGGRSTSRASSYGQPRDASEDGRNKQTTDARRMVRPGEGNKTSGDVPVRGVPRESRKRGEDEQVLANRGRAKARFRASEGSLEQSEAPGAHVCGTQEVPSGQPRSEGSVRALRMEREPSNDSRTESDRDPTRASDPLRRGRITLDFDPRRTAPQSGLHSAGEEGCSGGRDVLASSEPATRGNRSIQPGGVHGPSYPRYRLDLPRTCVSGGEDVPRWVTVRRITLNQKPTPLCEIGVTGSHTYIAEGLGTHNSLTPSVQKMLNAVGDFRRRIEVPECKRVFELKDDAQLWLCGTMNTSVYGGVYELNEDLKSRFRMLPVEYPSKGDETRILSRVVSNGVKKETVKDVLTLAHETRQKSLAYSLSPRDTVQILEDVGHCGLEDALRLASGKFEGQDRDYFLSRVSSVFGITIK